jgi:transcriptional regulator, TetR family
MLSLSRHVKTLMESLLDRMMNPDLVEGVNEGRATYPPDMDSDTVGDDDHSPRRRGADGYAPGRARRAQILRAAIELFGEHGYRATSLREIATHCGITHAGVLHHFPTKEALLVAVLKQRDAEDTEGLQTEVTSWQEAGQLLLDAVQANITTRRGLVELFVTLSAEATSSDHPAHQYFVERYERARRIMERGYRMAAEEGILRPGIDPHLAAAQLVAVMDGLQLQWLLSDGTFDMLGATEAFVRSQLVDDV